jgi:amino-acid N-acetyltransferase
MSITIRAATANDQDGILRLARGERVKPIGLRWPNFMIAERANELVGMVQLRQHPDGSRELGTLVVRRDSRQQGIAAMLIDALLAKENGRILMVTGTAHAHHYARWRFAPIAARLAPVSVRWNYWMGLYGGRMISLLQRRPFNRLAILDRSGA